MSEALDLLAAFHPVPEIAAQLRDRVAEEREAENNRGLDAIQLIKELQFTVTHSQPTTRAEWVAYAEALEALIGEFEL